MLPRYLISILKMGLTTPEWLPFPVSLELLGVLVVILLIGARFLRRALLPKPIPGVPYSKADAEKLFGNGLDLLAWKKEHGEMFGYVAQKAADLNAPIFQIFVHPFGKPWVVIADNREAHDIMTRRTGRDFDRSRFLADLLSSFLPEVHVHMPTSDRWKAHRKLIADTMSPAFLSEVAGPRMWEATMKAIELWRLKTKLAQGRPFSVKEDLRKAAFEIIWTATFGVETGVMQVQSDLLLSLPKSKNLPDTDQPVEFPIAPDPAIFKAGFALNYTLQVGTQSLFPKLYLFLAYNCMPSLRAARKVKDDMIQSEMKKAVDKFSTKTDIKWEDTGNLRRYMKSAMDIVIARELQSARKGNRAPDPLSRIVHDELFGFMFAGNEMYTLAAWTLKFLTAYQDVQTNLRRELHTQLNNTSETGGSPTAPEIGSARLPYFEAVIEEALRCGEITQTNIRTTRQDVNILGHLIPKDTEVMMLNNGPGIFMPLLQVEEEKRTESSRAAIDKFGGWDPKGLRDFDPTRWLIEDDEGRISFNAAAGPRHSFGAGPRACFGESAAHTVCYSFHNHC